MSKRILVTGVSGFIAKHVALQLLQKGYDVCGTLRALNKADQIKKSLSDAGGDISRLSFAAADLTKDDGWEEAARGCVGVMHVASPFPVAQPSNRNALIPAARGGVLRVLKAADKSARIVITSSMVAMMYRPNRPETFTVEEADWTDTSWKSLSAYIVSKTEAEKAAWQTAVDGGYKHRITTVNPGLVFGPALDDDIGASLDVIRLLMTGAYPAVPPVSYPVVDVRDVAQIHVNALENPETSGRRLIAASETLSLSDIAEILRQAFPDRAGKIPSRVLPAWLVRLLAVVDRNIATVLADLGSVPQADSDYVRALTGVNFRPARDAVIDAARSLERIKSI
ncbi:NAD-dependent epimerase/dehydratase family protein [Hyphococcus flavus]|uniref:NAD-dependent epimerase/dehydratase family protein n=1 Tax=Hyphococcus flavus TaxID=1866326 RepID=A0AAF0CF41_9PROT|nr:NAD-dependent epimerase/dehydratase family protein [Hyphococcus flavus]WDI31019.1 NAD-dependent epimerase/dehydratase family protein [Hyphococcus flavus]